MKSMTARACTAAAATTAAACLAVGATALPAAAAGSYPGPVGSDGYPIVTNWTNSPDGQLSTLMQHSRPCALTDTGWVHRQPNGDPPLPYPGSFPTQNSQGNFEPEWNAYRVCYGNYKVNGQSNVVVDFVEIHQRQLGCQGGTCPSLEDYAQWKTHMEYDADSSHSTGNNTGNAELSTQQEGYDSSHGFIAGTASFKMPQSFGNHTKAIVWVYECGWRTLGRNAFYQVDPAECSWSGVDISVK